MTQRLERAVERGTLSHSRRCVTWGGVGGGGGAELDYDDGDGDGDGDDNENGKKAISLD